MYVDKSEVKLLNHMGSDLSVVNAAKVSFGKQISELNEKDIKLIKYLADNSHTSPFEHVTFSFYIKCPLYISHQIMRHRTFSYNQISRRYTSEKIEFYVPLAFRKQHKLNKQSSSTEVANVGAYVMTDVIDEAVKSYNLMLQLGVSRELARGVLPTCLMTEFWMTGNLLNFTKFIKLRSHEGAQKEVVDIANEISNIISEIVPLSHKYLLSKGE